MKILDQYRKSKYNKRCLAGVRKNYSKLTSGPELSKEQEREIKKYYKDLIGIDVSLEWHRYFYKRTGVYSPKYIPTDLYYSSLIGKFNHIPFNEAYTDKNLTDVILSGIRQPRTILKNIRGYFYIEGKPVDFQTAVSYCSDLGEVVIKPTFAAHGEGVRRVEMLCGKTNVEGLNIKELFAKYGTNYMVQNVVCQHEKMNALNHSSVNTIRIVTYRSGMEVLVLYSVIRIGREGFPVDNETAGGISTKINEDGSLCKYAFGAPGNEMVEQTDTNVVLEGYKIPSFEKAVDAVRNLHYQLPHFDLIGWDIAIDADGEPLLIEWNTWPELSQTAAGPAFGDYTERILNEVWTRKNSMNPNWK